jgi:hypothetical protein
MKEFAKGKFEENVFPIPGEARHLKSLPGNLPLPAFQVLFQPAAMALPEVLGHQHRQPLAKHLVECVPEDIFGSMIDEQDLAVIVDCNNRVGGLFRRLFARAQPTRPGRGFFARVGAVQGRTYVVSLKLSYSS